LAAQGKALLLPPVMESSHLHSFDCKTADLPKKAATAAGFIFSQFLPHY
jgi:hypothetical protein